MPRVFVATWNVGGKSPHSGLNLDDFLHVHDQADIYVLGYWLSVSLSLCLSLIHSLTSYRWAFKLQDCKKRRGIEGIDNLCYMLVFFLIFSFFPSSSNLVY